MVVQTPFDKMGHASPKFALDFTGAALDSRVAVTRALNTATRINSNGYIEAVNTNLPRFDFTLNTGGRCKGLLVEETRANVLTYSSGFDNAIWVAETGITKVGYDAAVAGPDGVLGSAYELSIASGAGGTGLRYNTSVATLGLTTHAVTVYVRAKTTPVKLRIWASGNSSSSDITVTTDWTRIENVTSDTAGFVRIITRPGVSGDGGNIYLWGSQAENGAFSTSYIPTTTTSVTRNADVATITGTNFSDWWKDGSGSALVKARPSTVSGTRPWVQFDDATADNIIALRGNTTNPELYIRTSGSDQAQIDAGTIAANVSYRLAGAWAPNDCAASLNGGAPALDGVATIPVVTQARLGTDGTNYLNGHLETVEYYDKRLSSASLQVVSSAAGYRSIIGPVFRDAIIL